MLYWKVGLRKSAVGLFLLLAVAVLCCPTFADLTYHFEGVEESVPITQLWYEGNWTELAPFSAPMTRNSKSDLRGKVIIIRSGPPFETAIRTLQAKKPIGVVLVRTGTFPPGWAMQYVDGSDRSDIVVPVMEVVLPKTLHLDAIAEGTIGHFAPTPNLHKRAAESKFQLFMNLILSFWQMAIMSIGAYRIYQFYVVAKSQWIAIAPICCLLELIAATIRLSYTIVDPFWTYRMIPGPVSNVLVTLSIPISEAAGILLTLFCTHPNLGRPHDPLPSIPIIISCKSTVLSFIKI